MLASSILLSFLFGVLFTSPVSAQNAVCLPGWEWTYNVNGSSPCDVAASLRAACQNDPAYALATIADGYHYEANGECCCNLQVFNLESACGACQGRGWITWDRWTATCGSPSTGFYPNTIPDGLVFQAWAGMRTDQLPNGNWTSAAAAAVLVEVAGVAQATKTGGGAEVNVGVLLAAVLGSVGAIVLLILAYVAWRKQHRQTEEDEPLSPSSAAFRAASRSPRPQRRNSPNVHRQPSSETMESTKTITSSTPLVPPGPRSEMYRQPSPYTNVSSATTNASSAVYQPNRYSPPASTANGWNGSVANTSMATANISPPPREMAQSRQQQWGNGGSQYATLGYANAMNAATSGGGGRGVRGPRAPGAPGRAGTPSGYSGLGEIM